MEELYNLGAPAGTDAQTDVEGATYDLTSAESPSFEILPKGTYPVVVDEFEYTQSQSSGNPMLKVVYQVSDGEYAERKLFDYLVLAGDGAKFSLPRLKQLVMHTCPEVDLSKFNPKNFAEEGTILNRPCQIKVIITTQKSGDYKGEKRNQIREIMPAAAFGNSFLG